jgi:cytochrome c553
MANSQRRSALPVRGESDHGAGVRWRLDGIMTATALGTAIIASAHCAEAQDPAAGRQKALQCQACHGLDGLAKIPGAPHLAGQVQDYLVTAMRDYKSGARRNEMMTVVMRQLSDDDIGDLAAYYAGLDPSVKGER